MDPVTLKKANRYTDQHGGTLVDAYGTKGDGITDDTAAIQRAIASITNKGALVFSPGRKYRISETLDIDVSKVRLIRGNNAQLIGDLDGPILNIRGTLTGSANPDSGGNVNKAPEEFAPTIDGLHLCSSSTPYTATGIRVSRTVGLTINGCFLFNLSTGIEFVDRSRNVIMTGNSIWNCSDYGIHWNNVNLHQQNLVANHISYCRVALFMEDASIYNLQITGCDIESNATSAVPNPQSLLRSSGVLQESTITGCTWQCHKNSSAPLIDVDEVRCFAFVGNHLSNAPSGAIRFETGRGIVVSGNTMDGIAGAFVHAGDYVVGLVVADNTGRNMSGEFVRLDGSGSTMRIHGNELAWNCRSDFLVINASGNYHSLHLTNNACVLAPGAVILRATVMDGNPYLERSIIANNSFTYESSDPSLEGAGIDFGTLRLAHVQIKDNVIRNNTATTTPGAVIKSDGSELVAVRIEGNSLRAVSTSVDFKMVEMAASTVQACSLVNNVCESFTSTKVFDVPATFLVEDNELFGPGTKTQV